MTVNSDEFAPDMAAHCSYSPLWGPGEFRLVEGTGRCEGKLEMKKQNETWKPVCEQHSNLKFANKVCKELDCGSAVSAGPKWDSVRLVHGSNLCSGRLEVQSNQSWSSVCEEHFDLHDAQVVCRELGCGAPSVLQGFLLEEAKASLWKTFQCEGNEFALLDCGNSVSDTCSSGKTVELICSDSVRLVRGSSLCSGRLEVQSNQSWSSVCEEHFDLHDAQVVCRELGCGAPSVLQGALYEEAKASLWKTFQCEGNEFALLDCGSSVSDTCSSGKAVELICSDPHDVRLVGRASRCDGEVQVKHVGEWRHVETLFDFWTVKASDVICRQLNCGSAVSVSLEYRSDYVPVWGIEPACVHSTSVLRDCVTRYDHSSPFTLSITCSDSVRLVNGSSLCSGRLEVKTNRFWSSVCEEHFDLHDAQVVCRELGCGAPLVLQGALYGQGKVLYWTSEFQCEGNESALMDCGRSSSAEKTCSHGKATGLTCADPVRLVGEPSHCAGTLEVKHQGEWRPVIERTDQEDLRFGSVCQNLDCGSVVSVKFRNDFAARPVWRVISPCLTLTSGLKDCTGVNIFHNYTSGVDLVCSDLLTRPVISLSDGVSEVYLHGFRLLMGSDFTIKCSIEPQYPGGFFQLISTTSKPQNQTLPAVNHSAHFLFSAAGYTHRGNYICIYHVNVFNHNFSSSESRALYLTVGVSSTELVLRALIIILSLLIYDIVLFYYYKVSVRRIRLKAERNRTSRIRTWRSNRTARMNT
ncbi:scavenger receptor cysteine-rich type 1 protein M130-like [Sphaeramia orbicularis]|uniref:scavenger receptor cysteine-rich type 1 protein M130-like n=1 Tax=Sphaeramia orbicularis TaxID=375764 RepID=UPI00117CEA18|nr:scavenger receptor cysteine-rich type 1 protein M130-like [Sphaeramia orbicularis]